MRTWVRLAGHWTHGHSGLGGDVCRAERPRPWPQTPRPTDHRSRRGSTSRVWSRCSLRSPGGTWAASPRTGWYCTLEGRGTEWAGRGLQAEASSHTQLGGPAPTSPQLEAPWLSEEARTAPGVAGCNPGPQAPSAACGRPYCKS